MRNLLALLIFLTPLTVGARMYQWVEPDFNTTQLSGKPPAWYRSMDGGPRVFVFENGRLIDDTAIEVADDVRIRMRQEAFVLVEIDRQKAKAKMEEALAKQQKIKKLKLENIEESERDDVNDDESSLELITDTLFPENNEDEVAEENDPEKSLDELRALIVEWEKSQTEKAKQAIE